MKVFKGVVVTTYQQEITVEANTKEEAELLMYENADPTGDGVSGEMEVQNMEEVKC
jgi:hypothetical protein